MRWFRARVKAFASSRQIGPGTVLRPPLAEGEPRRDADEDAADEPLLDAGDQRVAREKAADASGGQRDSGDDDDLDRVADRVEDERLAQQVAAFGHEELREERDEEHRRL